MFTTQRLFCLHEKSIKFTESNERTCIYSSNFTEVKLLFQERRFIIQSLDSRV